MEEAGICVRIEKVQRVESQQALILDERIHRNIQRMFQPFRHHPERRVTAKPDTDVFIRFSIDDKRRWNIDVAILESHQLAFPILILKLEEQRAQCC